MPGKLRPKILVIESTDSLKCNLNNTKEKFLFDVDHAKSSAEALTLAKNASPNIILISSELHGQSAKAMLSQLEKIEKIQKVPVLFAIENSEPESSYIKHNTKFNTHIIKRPFSSPDLMGKVKDLIRKSNPVLQSSVLEHKDIKMDLLNYDASVADKPIKLGPKEFKLLNMFLQDPDKIFSREEIIKRVWSDNAKMTPRTVDAHINRIRKTVKKTNAPSIIKTVRSKGYAL